MRRLRSKPTEPSMAPFRPSRSAGRTSRRPPPDQRPAATRCLHRMGRPIRIRLSIPLRSRSICSRKEQLVHPVVDLDRVVGAPRLFSRQLVDHVLAPRLRSGVSDSIGEPRAAIHGGVSFPGDDVQHDAERATGKHDPQAAADASVPGVRWLAADEQAADIHDTARPEVPTNHERKRGEPNARLEVAEGRYVAGVTLRGQPGDDVCSANRARSRTEAP